MTKRFLNAPWPASERPAAGDFVYGALIGTVRIVDCVPLAQVADDPFAAGPWCWLLADPQPIDPIPWKGRTSLFWVPYPDDSQPTIAWIKRTLRESPYASRRVNVLKAYIVGSVARGTARLDSDLDIAVVIPPIRGKSALRYSEEFHAKFPSDDAKPRFNGRRVDFQFFYPGDLPADYARITLA